MIKVRESTWKALWVRKLDQKKHSIDDVIDELLKIKNSGGN